MGGGEEEPKKQQSRDHLRLRGEEAAMWRRQVGALLLRHRSTPSSTLRHHLPLPVPDQVTVYPRSVPSHAFPQTPTPHCSLSFFLLCSSAGFILSFLCAEPTSRFQSSAPPLHFSICECPLSPYVLQLCCPLHANSTRN